MAIRHSKHQQAERAVTTPCGGCVMSNAVLGAGNTQANMLAALAGSVVDPTNFLRTDAGNALLFVAIFRADLRYIEAWRTWAHWNGRRWELLSDTEGCSIAEAQL